jgi:hypothetical protein
VELEEEEARKMMRGRAGLCGWDPLWRPLMTCIS